MRFPAVSFLFIAAIAACSALPPDRNIPQQTQAAAVAVPLPPMEQSPGVRPQSVLAVVACRRLISLLVIDEHGFIHSTPHDATAEQVDAISHSVPTGHTLHVEVPMDCGAVL